MEISKIKIKSTLPLLIVSREQKKDVIYITIDQWIYSAKNGKYTAIIVDYVKISEDEYREINKKIKSFSKEEVDGLFTALNNPITIGENYSSEMDSLLIQALYYDTVTNLYEDGTTVYGASPSDWIIDNE